MTLTNLHCSKLFGIDAKMMFKFIILPIVLSQLWSSFADDVTINIKGARIIGTTDDNFVCATMDWWPSDKCDYHQCPWGQAGIPYLDLTNKILPNAIKAFSPLRIRLGGSLQDQVIYKLGGRARRCHNFKRYTNGLFGFSKGCLTMERWDEWNKLLSATGAKVTFGLNAMMGKRKSLHDATLYVGSWNSKNARDFIQYTVSKGYQIDSYEFGNELSGTGIGGARVEAEQYAKDVIVLKKLIQELYNTSLIKPKLMAPGGFYDTQWFETFLQQSGPNVVDVVSHHIYNLGAGIDPNLFKKMQDPNYLDQVAQTYKKVRRTIKKFGPWSSAWVGESGGAYNSGGKDLSNTFIDSYWYLDQLGMTSSLNHKVFCRQTLIGGNYGLLDTQTFVPNPDYYSALLWHRLMGSKVLSTSHKGSPYLRSYAHCSKKKGVTVLLINLSGNTSFSVSLAKDMKMYRSLAQANGRGGILREEYHLTPQYGNLRSRVMLLNGSPLQLTTNLDIPPLNPTYAHSSLPINVAPNSIVFAVIRNLNVPACA